MENEQAGNPAIKGTSGRLTMTAILLQKYTLPILAAKVIFQNGYIDCISFVLDMVK